MSHRNVNNEDVVQAFSPTCGPIDQSGRSLPSQGRGRGFESRWVHFLQWANPSFFAQFLTYRYVTRNTSPEVALKLSDSESLTSLVQSL